MGLGRETEILPGVPPPLFERVGGRNPQPPMIETIGGGFYTCRVLQGVRN